MLCSLRYEMASSWSYANCAVAYDILFRYIPVMLLAILYSFISIKFKTCRHTQENSGRTLLSHSGKDETETCFKYPLLSFQCLFCLFFFFCFLLFNINFLIFWDWAGSTHLSCFFFFFLNILALDVTCYMSSAYGVINPIICLFISSNHRYGLTRLLSFRFASVGFKLCRGTFTNKTHLIGT